MISQDIQFLNDQVFPENTQTLQREKKTKNKA